MKGVSNIKKTELLRALGRLHMMEYYKIPKIKRVTIVEEGLQAMVGTFFILMLMKVENKYLF